MKLIFGMIMPSLIAVLNKRKSELISIAIGVFIGYVFFFITSAPISLFLHDEIKIPMDPFPEPAW